MNSKNPMKYSLPALGAALPVFGLFISANYAFRMNGDRDWGTNSLLYDVGFIVLGIAFQLFGLGLITLSKALPTDTEP